MSHTLKFAAVLACAAALNGTAAEAQSRFDLNCRVNVVGLSPTPAFRLSGRETLRIIVDITQRKFCINECDVVEALEASDGTIRGRSGDTEFLIDRRSGEMEFLRHGLYEAAGRGVCDTASFTGFPRRGFAGEGATSEVRPRAIPEDLGVDPASRAPPREQHDRAVQIGSFSSVQIAQRELERFAERYREFTEGAGRQIQPVMLSSGMKFYRQTFTGFTQGRATEFCY